MNGRRAAIFGLAGALTLGGLLSALWLGAWAFDVRRFTTHRSRLQRVLVRSPTSAQIGEAFRDEGTRLLGRNDAAASLHAFCVRFGGSQAAEMEAAAARFPATEAYLAGDVVYFIHYDAGGVMRGFALADARALRDRRDAARP